MAWLLALHDGLVQAVEAARLEVRSARPVLVAAILKPLVLGQPVDEAVPAAVAVPCRLRLLETTAETEGRPHAADMQSKGQFLRRLVPAEGPALRLARRETLALPVAEEAVAVRRPKDVELAVRLARPAEEIHDTGLPRLLLVRPS